ncbi:hypothetical protein BGY98DRAFT_944866, partial [Russula aff. rugulosa BPL654]
MHPCSLSAPPSIPPRLQDSQSHRDTRSLLHLHPSPHDIYPQKDPLALDSILASRLSMKVDRTARLSYRGSNLLPPRSSLTKVSHTTACVSVDLLTHTMLEAGHRYPPLTQSLSVQY